MVLVATPSGICARVFGDWPVCYELCSISARDEYGSAMKGAAAADALQ